MFAKGAHLTLKEVTMVALAKKLVEMFVRGSANFPQTPMFWAV